MGAVARELDLTASSLANWVKYAAGVGVGLTAALALSRFTGTLVFGISARDPITFAVVPLLLAIVAAGATIVPARRAARVDPMLAVVRRNTIVGLAG